MTSHGAHTFFNSCFKVPIDPCNNCPAPRYNRPNLCLGQQTLTKPLKDEVTVTTSTATKNSVMDVKSMWNRNVISSMTEFYDSIPDYCDINHLPEEEFYTTLKSLKIICQDFKSKSMHSYVMHETSSNSSSTHHSAPILKVKGPNSKPKRNKTKGGSKKSTMHTKEIRNKKRLPQESTEPSSSRAIVKSSCKNNIESYKEDFKEDTKTFQNAIKYSEMELKYSSSSDIQNANPESFQEEKQVHKESVKKIEIKETPLSDIPSRTTNLRKSYSLNNINNVKDIKHSEEGYREHTGKNPLIHDIKAEILAHKDRDKLSNYFMMKTYPEVRKMRCNTASCDTRTTQRKIPVESFCSDDFAFKYRTNGGHKKRKKPKKNTDKLSWPFTSFNLSDPTRKVINYEKSRNPSPVHPVARPNLAATLRVEVSKRKVHELQNNCTCCDDATPQNDWEVRNTPAWKSLSLNESHKQIIALRLATRKAEQALQKRIHEQNMELMRQRVKAAPLLLEGSTYWSNSVGKLTHSCQQGSIKHACQQRNPRKERRKTTSDCAISKWEHSGVTRSNSAVSSSKCDVARTSCANTPLHNKRSPEHSVAQTRQLSESSDNLSSADRSYL